MSNSRLRFRSDEKPSNSSRGKGLILETPYKPGFVDDKDLETVKMAVDKELSDISNAFYQTTERTADTITRVDKLEITGETQYGELVAKIETVDKVSKEGDTALAERITTFEASTSNEFGKVNAAITETNKVMADADKVLAEKIDSIVGSFEGELGPLLAQIDEVRKLSIDGDKAIGTRIDSMEVKFEQADKDLAASIKTEEESRVEQDLALSKRIDTLSSTVSTEDKKLSAAITTEQTARIEADKVLASQISKVEADYKTADKTINAAITTEQTARADADKALASSISKVEAEYKSADDKVAADSKALVQTEATARADGDSSLAGQITTVKAELENQVAEVRQFATVEIGDVTDAIAAEEAARLAAEAVLDGKITQEEADRLVMEAALRGEIKANENAISLEEANRLAEQAILDGKITKEEADRLIAQGVLQGNIDAANGEINKINAKWGVELDVNGKISGIVMNNNGARSNFEVRADVFKFTDTSGGTSGGFSSSGGVTTFNGIINAQAGVFNGTVNANGGLFNNVQINENCVVLGTLYADRIVGLPTGKSFGPTDHLLSGSWVDWASFQIPSAEGRFNMAGLVNINTPQTSGYDDGYASYCPAYRVLVNGNQVAFFYTPLPNYNLERYYPASGSSGKFIIGPHGGTVSIQVGVVSIARNGSVVVIGPGGSQKCRGYGNAGFLYNAIDA